MDRQRRVKKPILPRGKSLRFGGKGNRDDLSYKNEPAVRRLFQGAARFGFADRVQQELLNAPVQDFTDIKFIILAAIHLMDGAEFFQLFATRTEFPEDRAVEFHFVNGGVIEIAAVGIGAVKILMRPGGDTESPRRADIDVLSLEIAIGIEHLNALIAAVGD